MTSNKIKILIIDDDPIFLNAAEAVLKMKNYIVLTASSGNKGMEMLKENRDTKVLLLDLRMPDRTGEDILQELKEEGSEYRDMPLVIVVTADRDASKELEVLKLGADDFIVKPLGANELLFAIESVLRPPQESKLVGWTEIKYNKEAGDEFQGRSGVINSLIKDIHRIAKTESNVLIIGEPGTGKELVARMIHDNSSRTGRFVKIDPLGLPSYELVYSELWGHEQWVFAEAATKREGGASLADGGTLFLEEIGRLDIRIQEQLLRFLETHEFVSLGGSELRRVNVRVISATSLDIGKAIIDNQALCDYLGQEIIHVPPLRDRKEENIEGTIGNAMSTYNDIEILVDYAIDRYNKTRNKAKKVTGIENTALDILKKHEWPGNIRQLNNVINEAASRASARKTYPIITIADFESIHVFESFSIPEISTGSKLKNLYDRSITGDETDKREFADKVNEIHNIAGFDLNKAAKLLQISPEEMREYIDRAQEINKEPQL